MAKRDKCQHVPAPIAGCHYLECQRKKRCCFNDKPAGFKPQRLPNPGPTPKRRKK